MIPLFSLEICDEKKKPVYMTYRKDPTKETVLDYSRTVIRPIAFYKAATVGLESK